MMSPPVARIVRLVVIGVVVSILLRVAWAVLLFVAPNFWAECVAVVWGGLLSVWTVGQAAVVLVAGYLLLRLANLVLPGSFGTIHQMLFHELARVFLLCLFALAGIFTLLAVLQQIQFGVSLTQAMRMLPLLVPTSVPWITPPACLFASCVVYGRLANDNEAVAIKAAGVDLLSVLRPAVAVGLLAAVFTGYLQFAVTPAAWRGSREVLVEDPEEAIGTYLKRKQTLEFQSGDSLVRMRVRDVAEQPPGEERTADGQKAKPKQRLVDVILKQRKLNAAWDEPELVARTREAVLRVDTQAAEMDLDTERWEMLTSGGLGTTHPDKPAAMRLPAQFDLDVLRKLNRRNPAMLDWPDLPVVAAEAAEEAKEYRRLAAALAALGENPTPEQAIAVGLTPAAAADRGLVAKAMADNADRESAAVHLDLALRYEYHLRPAIAFGCLLFAVLGCPVGLWANRADYLSIFVICFLPSLVVYYPVLFMVGGYSREGKLPMALGVWAANGVLLAASVVLSRLLIRR